MREAVDTEADENTHLSGAWQRLWAILAQARQDLQPTVRADMRESRARFFREGGHLAWLCA